VSLATETFVKEPAKNRTRNQKLIKVQSSRTLCEDAFLKPWHKSRLIFSLLPTLIHICYVAVFQIRVKCDRTVFKKLFSHGKFQKNVCRSDEGRWMRAVRTCWHAGRSCRLENNVANPSKRKGQQSSRTAEVPVLHPPLISLPACSLQFLLLPFCRSSLR
jgi:hypothetical protein